MRRATLTALAGLTALGTLLGGADARAKPRAPVAPPVERLVLRSADAPGLAAVGRPADAGGAAVQIIASGNNLVLVTIAKGSAPYVNVIAPR